MASEDSGARTEAPTARRLQQARRQGQVPLSRVATAWAALAGGFAVAAWGSSAAILGVLDLFAMALEQAFTPHPFANDSDAVVVLLNKAAGFALATCMPVALAALSLGVLVSIVQTRGALVSLSTRRRAGGGSNHGHVALGAVLLVVMAGLLLWSLRGDIVRLGQISSAHALIFRGGELILWMAIRLLVVAGVWAAINGFWRWWRWRQGLFMSRRQVLEDMRMQEGHGEVRAARARLGREQGHHGKRP